MGDFKSSPIVNKNKKEDVIKEENESPDNDASMSCNENYYEMVAVTFDCKKVGHEPKMRRRHGFKFKGWQNANRTLLNNVQSHLRRQLFWS